jgi:hypothetical protein
LEIQEAANEYIAQSNDPFKMRIPITTSIFLTLAHRFYLENYDGLPPPGINQILTYMVQSGRFLPHPMFARVTQRLNHTSATILWQIVHNSAQVNPMDVSTALFGTGDPGDSIYGAWDYPTSVLHAQASMVDDESSRHDARDLLGFGSASSSSDGFIPLPSRASHHETTHAFTARRHPPRSGGLSAPRPPFEGLSTQTRVLLARRSAQTAANAAAETRALAAGIQASVRHAPPRTDPSDDEYEPEF